MPPVSNDETTRWEKRGSNLNFFQVDLRLVPETSAPKEHFEQLFSSGTSDPAKIRPLKIRGSPDFLSGFALWNFASGVQARGIAPVPKEYGKSQQLRALFFSLSRYRLNRSIWCFHFHLHQLHMDQGESVTARRLGLDWTGLLSASAPR